MLSGTVFYSDAMQPPSSYPLEAPIANHERAEGGAAHTRLKLLLTGCVWGGYLLVFFPLLPSAGFATAALSYLPVTLTGWFWGRLAGAGAGVLSLPLNLLFFALGLGGLSWLDVGQNAVGMTIAAILGGVLGYLRDLRLEMQRQQDRLVYLADHDALTGLLNRAAFYRLLGEALREAHAKDAAPLAVLFVDLDGFKTVNDSFGHETGDGLLEAVGARLKEHTRKGDAVARLGGDEFTLLLRHPEDVARAERVVQKLCGALRTPFRVGGRTLTVSASVGVSRYPDDGHDVRTLLKHADGAMYGAKPGRRGTWEGFGDMKGDAGPGPAPSKK